MLHGPSSPGRMAILGNQPLHLPVQVLDLSGCACLRELPGLLGDLRELKGLNLRQAPSPAHKSCYQMQLISKCETQTLSGLVSNGCTCVAVIVGSSVFYRHHLAAAGV